MSGHVILSGSSKKGNSGFSTDFDLWISDGTLSGTRQIKPAGDNPHIYQVGFQAGEFTPFGSKILFQALDKYEFHPQQNGGPLSKNLWVTDGTSKGTVEIGGSNEENIKGVSEYGWNAGNFVAFGKRVLFYGDDSSYFRGIWITDGTDKGTYELGGVGNNKIKGTYFAGLGAGNFTPLGDKIIFQGLDLYKHLGLWVTDGTTQGTFEIGGARNAGIEGAPTDSFEISHAIQVGGRLFFNAREDSGHLGFWVTDGTAKGTMELVGSESSIIEGVTSLGGGFIETTFRGKAIVQGTDAAYALSLFTTDGTTAGTIKLAEDQVFEFTSVGNKAFFTGFEGLWVTDGTAAGTKLAFPDDGTQVKDSYEHGLNITGLTRLGDKAVFSGEDASGQNCLWITDGTAKGTVEIGGLDNADVKGAYAGGLSPSDFVSIGDRVFFQGFDAESHIVLWVTDGTAKGTISLDHPKGAKEFGLDGYYTTAFPSGLSLDVADDFKFIPNEGLKFHGTVVGSAAVTSVTLLNGSKEVAKGPADGDKWDLTANLKSGTYNNLSAKITDAEQHSSVAAVGRNVLMGTSSRDTLKGGKGSDIIVGGAGNDKMFGASGADFLFGGSGKDVFIFDVKPSTHNVDTITDFSHAGDRIWLDDDAFNKVGQVPKGDKDGKVALSKDAFWASDSGKAHDGSDRILYDKTDGHLYYDADGSKGGKAVLFSDLASHLKIDASDFLIVA